MIAVAGCCGSWVWVRAGPCSSHHPHRNATGSWESSRSCLGTGMGLLERSPPPGPAQVRKLVRELMEATAEKKAAKGKGGSKVA